MSAYNPLQSTFYEVSCLLHVTQEFSLKQFFKHKLKTKIQALGAENCISFLLKFNYEDLEEIVTVGQGSFGVYGNASRYIIT